MHITFPSATEWGRTRSGFKTQRRHYQKSKTGVPVVLKKDMRVRQKVLKKNNQKKT